MNKVCRKVKSNLLLMQDCFVLERVERPIVSTSPLQEYYELERNTRGSAVVEELVKKEYPITPEYVASFVDSCDYKKDPALISSKHSGANLGDVSELQKALGMDSMQAQQSYRGYLQALLLSRQKLNQNQDLKPEEEKKENA